MPSKKQIIYEYLKREISLDKYPDRRIPNERDLAEELKVSQGTLRHALKRLEDDGVLERIRSRGTFIRTPQASSGAGRNFLCIMQNIREIENPFIYVLPGMESEAKQNGYGIVPLEYEQVANMKPADFNRIFTDKDFSGILLGVHQGEIHRDAPWSESPLPTVVAYSHGNYVFPDNLGVIRVNDREAWRMAVAHLLERGHRRIACLSSSNWNTLRGMPFEEYAKLLEANGADPLPGLIFKTNYNKQEIIHAVNKMLDIPRAPTALLCFSDFFAMYALEALKQRGWQVPEDMAVIGTCGYPGSEFFEVPLSTVSYNYRECGVNAVRLLLRADEWAGRPGKAPCISIPSVLIERASTAMQRVLFHPDRSEAGLLQPMHSCERSREK